MHQIQAENLRKVYRVARGREVVAVQGATLHVEAGEIYGLLGPNGAGKTTLLRMLATIMSPTSGECWVGGIAASERPEDVRRLIGFLSGNTKLYGRMKARELLRYFGQLYGISRPDIAQRTGEVADLLDMHEFLDQRCETLSTGQTQKVSIARVMMHDPKVLILDEPTLGLDIMTSRSILDFIKRARLEGKSIIFSTHYMAEAEHLCDRIGLIHRGEILTEDTPAGLLEASGTSDLQEAFLAHIDEDLASTS